MSTSIRERVSTFVSHLLFAEEKREERRQSIREAHAWHREKHHCEKHKTVMLWDIRQSCYVCSMCEAEKQQPIPPRIVDFSALETYDRATPPQHPALRPTRLNPIPSTPREQQTDAFLIQDISIMATQQMPAIKLPRLPDTGEYDWLT